MLLGKGEMTADMSTWRLVLKRSQSKWIFAGSIKRGGPVKRTDGEEQPEALVVKGVEIQGVLSWVWKIHAFFVLRIWKLDRRLMNIVRWSTNGAAFPRWETTLCLHLALLILGQAVLPWHVQARSAADPVGCRYRDSWFAVENMRKRKDLRFHFDMHSPSEIDA